MDRWYWAPSTLTATEKSVKTADGIRLYDGDKKTSFEDGHLTLTNLRLLWKHSSNSSSLALNLSTVVLADEEQSGFASSAKVVLHLTPPSTSNLSRPVTQSQYTFIKLSFRQGGISSFKTCLDETLAERAWEKVVIASATHGVSNTKQLRAGILGIERDIHAKHKEADSNINRAFEDLKNLMGLAKEMVNLSKNIANKIKEQTGEISSDETVQLRSYLLSLGVDDPVTKEAVGSTTEYHKRLAHELCSVLKSPIDEMGGVMLLSEVYCRINRARGLQLLSPEDVSNACSLMSSLKLPLKLFTFQSGVQILQLSTVNEAEVSDYLRLCLDDHKSDGISAIEFANASGMPLLLAQERLYHAERNAVAVRDESNEGLRFFPNLFFTILC